MKCTREVWYDDKLKRYHPTDRWSSEENQICGGKFIMSLDIEMKNNAIKLVANGYCDKCGGELDGYKPIDEMLTKFVEEME